MLFHVLVAKFGSLGPPVPVEHCKVHDIVRHMRRLVSVFIFLPLADQRGAAHLGQADFGNGFSVPDARWK